MPTHIRTCMLLAVASLGLSLLTTHSIGADIAPPALPDGLYAEFATPRGNFTCELFYQSAPLTVVNFSGLAEGKLGPEPRKPFYDGIKFHRVVPNFVVQGGDPQGNGEGGPGYEFPDEFTPGLRHDDSGILSMANAGPDTNGSQFFLTLKPVNRLNYLHNVFGRTVRGREVLPMIQQDDPILSVRILRIGDVAQAFHIDQTAFDTLQAAAKPYAASVVPGAEAHFYDPDALLPTEPPRAFYFNFQLANFERATGIKIMARLFAKFTPETPAQRPGTYTGSLARSLGLTKEGALVTYYADINKWGLWVGDTHLPRLMGRTGSVKEFMQDSALHRAKQALISAAMVQAEVYTVEGAARATPEKPMTAADKIKFQVDAMLETLIFKLEPES